MQLLERYFPELNPEQLEKFAQFQQLFREWNQKINLVSRKDIEHLEERHILHSLAIAKALQFGPGTHILDLGTGGGFPGIPLAIRFPEVEFLLVDSIGKKIRVVEDLAIQLQLSNVKARQCRVEEVKEKFDFVVSRAVTRLPQALQWIRGKVRTENRNSLPNGLLYLKGGDFDQELLQISQNYRVYHLSDWFEEEFFETKKLVWVGR